MTLDPKPPMWVRSESLADVLTPGVEVVLDPEEADSLGFFEETALSEDDVWDANTDLILGELNYGQ